MLYGSAMSATRPAYTLDFAATAATLPTVGGKGMNLGRLTRAGLPVPPGFFVTTAAYQAYVEAHHLQDRIFALVNDAALSSETTSAAIRQLFEQKTIPPEVVSSIQENYRTLMPAGGEPGPMAVRSSATAEDLPGASFAGQQESYLYVRGEEALLAAVKRCWASLWTARALEYRTRYGIAPGSVSLAVVIQVMIPAEMSGIMFTANPITGARDEIIVDAAWGLGEAVVGGLVTPDHIIVDKSTGAIKQVVIGDKAVMTVPTPTGTEERAVDVDRRGTQVLSAAQIAELVKLGAKIEALDGEPQDIEWCFAGRQFYIVQARPITTLAPEPVQWESPVAGAKWIRDMQAAEWVSEPLSPLGATTTIATMIAARQRRFPMQQMPWSALVNGWLYIRADFRVVPLAAHFLKMAVGIPGGLLDGHRRVRRTWPQQLALLNSLESIDLATLSDGELQAHVDKLLEALGWWWWEVSWDAAMALVGEQLIRKMRVPNLADPAALFRGNDSLLLEAERVLRQAAKTGDVEDYLARFGHFVESADPLHPTLRESPALVAQYLAVARRSETSPDERLAHGRAERAEAENHVYALKGARGYPARLLLGAGQSHAAYVDDAVFHCQRVLARIRASLLEIGRRMASTGALEQAEDVFYLEWGELWQPPSGIAQRVLQRRTLRESQKRLAPPAFIPPLSDATWENDRLWRTVSSLGEAGLKRGVQERNGRQILVGTPGSPGRAQGIARVIRGPDDFHRFQPGDVLVAHATTPIWTPLFNIAGAAVTEVGGPFSHAAIVAREFGIPLVNGALDATRLVADGTPVIVDGSAGVVEFELI
jgi:phosphohistidine swiveling domain-containing protein